MKLFYLNSFPFDLNLPISILPKWKHSFEFEIKQDFVSFKIYFFLDICSEFQGSETLLCNPSKPSVLKWDNLLDIIFPCIEDISKSLRHEPNAHSIEDMFISLSHSPVIESSSHKIIDIQLVIPRLLRVKATYHINKYLDRFDVPLKHLSYPVYLQYLMFSLLWPSF